LQIALDRVDSEFSDRCNAIVEIQTRAASRRQREIIRAPYDVAILMKKADAALQSRARKQPAYFERNVLRKSLGATNRTFHVLPVPDRSKFIAPVLAVMLLRAAAVSWADPALLENPDRPQSTGDANQ
jgi:hypothetical protein